MALYLLHLYKQGTVHTWKSNMNWKETQRWESELKFAAKYYRNPAEFDFELQTKNKK